jgi:hypothetical protein
MTAAVRISRVVPSSPVPCPACRRPAGLCCVNEHGAVRRGGQHRERVAEAAERLAAGRLDAARADLDRVADAVRSGHLPVTSGGAS